MMNEFILCSSATGSGYYLAETKPCQYECHSYIAPLSRDYYGNYGVPSCSPRKKLPGATLKHIAASSPTTGTSANITL